MSASGKHSRSFWDKAGIGLSLGCMLHCLIPLIVLVAMPGSTSVIEHDTWVHALLLVVIIPVTMLTFRLGYKQHGRITVVLAGTLAVILLTVALLMEHFSGWPLLATGITAVASILLITCHLANLRWHRHAALQIAT